MKNSNFLFAALAAALSLGCGSSSKKKEKTATTVPFASSAPAAVQETSDPATETGSPAAALQNAVYFEFDLSTLDESAREKLQENANWMEEDLSRVLTIEGHTDEEGTTDYNLALGERRARMAKDYLVRLGVDASRIQIITYGEERPASSDNSLNRRSMFVATKK